ncbi:unnamed protein product [Oppiella nova]|uniref:Active breakpoint cluster region-related protein n=1 Tax=Oppiella nova TaxID=334625 RepID=A0A7R9LVW1_9ACAR|nr:unnamed protein product [Oppiella nova]CAG2167164.1 unnamed protein product [Oppiella nova]
MGESGDDVLADFSQAWAHRFGHDCQLPTAWEDDVRANLLKHQTRVTTLKHELEKEEFYVQYLQKLLHDADRVKGKGRTVLQCLTMSNTLSSVAAGDGHPSDASQVDSHEGSDGTTAMTPVKEKDDQYVTVITVSSYGEIQRPAKVDTKAAKQPLIDNPLYQTSHALPDVSVECEVAKKKRPPTPPRKPKVMTNTNMTSISVLEDHNNGNQLVISRDNSLSKKSIGCIGESGEQSEQSVDTTSVLYDDDENNIYDTVAPDEPSVCNVNANHTKHTTSDLIDSNSSTDNLSAKYYDLNSYANYVNIDYFLRKDETSSRDDSDDNETQVSQSLSSDHEIDDNCQLIKCPIHLRPNKMNAIEVERLTMYKCIIASITESETIYVDCLNTLIQYMKALKSTLGTTHPLLTPEELSTIFYKIPELYSIHWTFLEGLKKLSNSANCDSNETNANNPMIGELFKVLASRLGAYSAFLKNYSKALETVHKCSATNNQFCEITRSIKIMSLKGQSVTIEELLHKPVARVQKNALVLHDLLKYTNEGLNEYKSLKTALKMTQCFLNDLNIAATEQMFPIQDKTQRRLVKESFIVESSDEKRKLRHLFLFNDVIVCAKYKAAAKQKFTFELKSYNMLNEITILDTEISNTRDLIAREEEKEKGKLNTKLLEKLKKKRSDLEAHLVLYLPQLKFSMSHKSGKIYTFYLSSDFERSQWIESIKAWIETCRKNLNPNSLGSFLLRSSKDDDLLFGDLYLTVKHLKGLSREADILFILELDTYGHYIQRGVTHVSRQSLEPHFDQEFVLDLEGTQTLRILCYEEISGQQKPFFRGKASLELSQTWLSDKQSQQMVPILDCILTLNIRYVSSQSQTARFPASKVCGAFGVNVQQVCRKEKTSVPYLITSCIREVERRGMKEVGVYRVSGLSSDVQKLKKSFETNPYEAELLMKEMDIHSVTGLLKLYLRELPESLFTNALYKKYFDAFSELLNMTHQSEKSKRLLSLFAALPQPNQTIVAALIDHFYRVNQFEEHNKMSLHNLATVFGPTVLRAGGGGGHGNPVPSVADSFTAGTIDVMAQAGILYFFLLRRASGISLTTTETQL